MTASGVLVYGANGTIFVCPPSLSGNGAPLTNLKGILGQQYFDKSVTPPAGYVWSGSAWTPDSGSATLGSLDVNGTANINVAGTSPTNIGNTTGNTTVNGDLTMTNGNVIINGAAKQLRVHGGAATDFIGTATLVAGTVTIANTNIAATDRIFIQRTAANASTTLGELTYTISGATSFTVTSLILGTPASTQTADVSSFTYFIVRQV